jgi:hypothetical protein
MSKAEYLKIKKTQLKSGIMKEINCYGELKV